MERRRRRYIISDSDGSLASPRARSMHERFRQNKRIRGTRRTDKRCNIEKVFHESSCQVVGATAQICIQTCRHVYVAPVAAQGNSRRRRIQQTLLAGMCAPPFPLIWQGIQLRQTHRAVFCAKLYGCY